MILQTWQVASRTVPYWQWGGRIVTFWQGLYNDDREGDTVFCGSIYLCVHSIYWVTYFLGYLLIFIINVKHLKTP